ncbi:PH domain-like protein [Massarina eburnea CBS 473.64]|uniref:PH domain-like protein n=1 Tax=Massarina eburnea CBS 473.64 TaxID=1395130 RepID=A0A6A6RTH8_9PLEO|nr:PH domain-like protein [Massarina eburnea CBS 473.64]
MAPNRKARAQQAHPPPQPSDYETDAPVNVNISPPPPRSNEELNFSVIRRHYPEVTAMHYVVSYAALYVFGGNTEGWERAGTEGSLFLCELEPSPQGIERFAVIILNRKGLDNFTLEITSPDTIDFDEFIVIQNGPEQAYGLWVMNDPPPSSTANARVELQNRLLELAERAQRSRDVVEAESRTGGSVVYEQVETSVEMGRQLSLRELFGQPRDPAVAPPPPTQSDALSQLWMKAKQDYNGMAV